MPWKAWMLVWCPEQAPHSGRKYLMDNALRHVRFDLYPQMYPQNANACRYRVRCSKSVAGVRVVDNLMTAAALS